MKKNPAALDFVPSLSEKSCHGREVSSRDVRGLVRLVAESPAEANDEQRSFVFALKGARLDRWIGRSSARAAGYLSLLHYLDHGDPAYTAEFCEEPIATVQHRIDSYLGDVAAAYNARARHSAERDRDRGALDSWCDMTHRQAGGDGGTPPIGRREWAASNCPACAARAALFGPAGWLEAEERNEARKARRKLADGQGDVKKAARALAQAGSICRGIPD